jgi:3-phenylpropionate/trans-cinnamate dioxygenase ferredoxin subunit
VYNYRKVDEAQVEFVTVGSVGDLPEGERLLVEIDGRPLAVFRIAGKYFAIADICSHDDGPVAEGARTGYEIECPRHGARFDVRDGRVLSLPAVVDIPAYPVRVVGDEIQVGVPPEA